MIILQYHEIFFRPTAPRCPGKAAGAVSLRKSHDIIILSFCNIVKGQAKYFDAFLVKLPNTFLPLDLALKYFAPLIE